LERESELERIKDILKINPKGLTIEEVSKNLSLNRATAAKYLNSLVMSGQADLRELGRAKLFYLSQRLPLTNLLSLSSDLILILDKDLFIQEVNDQFSAFFTLSKDELKGRKLEYSSLAPFLTDEHFSALKNALGGSGSSFETRINSGGENRFFKLKFIPLVFEAGGQAAGIIFEDITEMKRYQLELEQRVMERTTELMITNDALEKQIEEHLQADKALRESEEDFRRMVETANEGIWVVDASITITFANWKLTEILGYSDEEMVGKNITEFIFPEDRPDHDLRVRNCIGGMSETYERRFRRKDGSECWTLNSVAPIVDETGTFSGAFAMLTDITDRKRLEANLEQKSRYYELLLHTSTDAIHIIDRKGALREWNDAFLSHLGYSPAEAVSLIMADWDQQTSLDQLREQLVSGDRKSIRFETRHRRKDGTYRDVDVTASSVTINGEEMLYVSARDITEHKHADEAIKKANKQISLLTSVTRHDILNQLSTMEGYLALMENNTTERCPDLVRNMETIARTIRQQIIFTRNYQNIGMQPPQWNDIRNTISLVLPMIEKGSALVIVDTGSLEIYADILVEKVFYNLIENALRHGEHVTQIRVSSHLEGKDMKILVEDNGTGIPEPEKETIFSRGVGKNTGYGLFLAREILAITDIAIRESGEPGKGARF
jgi:PAS domain S-box-containing protein